MTEETKNQLFRRMQRLGVPNAESLVDWPLLANGEFVVIVLDRAKCKHCGKEYGSVAFLPGKDPASRIFHCVIPHRWCRKRKP